MGFAPGEIRLFGCRFGRKSAVNDKRGVNGLGSTICVRNCGVFGMRTAVRSAKGRIRPQANWWGVLRASKVLIDKVRDGEGAVTSGRGARAPRKRVRPSVQLGVKEY